MYARDVAGRELTFGVSGKLIMNALVLYDRETDTLWSQFLGVAVKGPLEGTRLEPLPSTLLPWGTWRELHPDTLVLDQGGRRNDQYDGYYTSGNTAGVLGETNADDRLPLKEFVLGLQLGDSARAYPFRYLSEVPVFNDTLDGADVAVVFDREAGAGVIFKRAVGGRTLSFEIAETADGPPLIRDRETGTLWSGLTGEALSGPLAGERVEMIPSFAVFWFAWSDYFPGAEIFDPRETAG